MTAKPVPKPSASFGQWRNEVVRHHQFMNKAGTRQTRLERKLALGELKDNENDDQVSR